MSKIEHLVNKILEDAESESKRILEEAEAEKELILRKKLEEAKKVEKTIIDKANEEAALKRERMLSNVALKLRNEKLEVKQKIIDEVFEQALNDLCSMSKEAFLTYLKSEILKVDIKGDEKLILNSYGKNIVSISFVDEVNTELLSMGKVGRLTISEETRNFRGGFILEKDGVEINNTFEALISSYREELEPEVVSILF
ncbi:V-type ATP synthase subunit E [Clostridium manihotivorum]|uniref:V-type proton ATPase subunit E n=1 Tax=Clostridium manihotivorum TaxID=2320868 RepID=A0A410DXX1_9CLOT|nr:V-type ATP synthase subunit E [Clostridium manihotivorum]QAA34063.1 V-type ATP synthase subunit E [Clostridium manihotivorum]